MQDSVVASFCISSSPTPFLSLCIKSACLSSQFCIFYNRQWRIHRWQGDVSPRFQAEMTVMQSPPLFWHTILACFTRLTGYARKTPSSTAIQLAHRMHQNFHFKIKKQKKKFWGGCIASSSVGRGTLLSHPARWRLVPRARHDSSFHFLNRGYAPDNREKQLKILLVGCTEYHQMQNFNSKTQSWCISCLNVINTHTET